MRFAGLKFIFEICLQLQLEACLCDVIMTLKYQVEVGDGNKKIFLRPENESTLRFYEIWLFGRLHTARFS